MKTLTKDNFMVAVTAFVKGQGTHKDEYWETPAELAKDFLTEFYENYFEIDTAKEARRVEYLKLKEEFGDE